MLSMEAIKPNHWDTLAPHFDALLATDLTSAELPHWLRRWSDLEKTVWEERAGLKRARSMDIANQSAQQAFDDFTVGTFSNFKFATQQLKAKVLSFSAHPSAPQHLELLRRWHSEAELFRPDNVPLQAEIDLLADRYDGLVRTNDEGLPPSDSTEYSQRRRNQHWLQQRQPIDQLFLELRRLRRQLARNAGVSDYRAYRWRELGRLDYTPDQCLHFHEAVATDLVPLAALLLARSSEPSKMLPQCDIFATASLFESDMQPVMAAIDPELGTLFAQMRSGYLDLGKRPHKARGSEEWIFPVTEVPYVRVDADGTVEGISLLLHECGHAFHDFLSIRRQNLIWNLGGPTEFEEFAAIALTYLGLPHLHHSGIYSAADLAQIAIAQVKEAIVRWLPHIIQIDAFQHWLYTEAPEDLQAPEIDAQWLKLAKRFQPAIAHSGAQSGVNAEDAIGWQQVGLLFHAPFYNIEYALAHLGALQLHQHMQVDPVATWRAYRSALAQGNTLSLPELYAKAGARLPLDPQVVREIAETVARDLEL